MSPVRVIPLALLAPLALSLAGCGNDSSFTALTTPEPPGEDTSAPPTEEVEEVIPEEPEVCPDRIYSGTTTVIREDCRTEPPVVRYHCW